MCRKATSNLVPLTVSYSHFFRDCAQYLETLQRVGALTKFRSTFEVREHYGQLMSVPMEQGCSL